MEDLDHSRHRGYCRWSTRRRPMRGGSAACLGEGSRLPGAVLYVAGRTLRSFSPCSSRSRRCSMRRFCWTWPITIAQGVVPGPASAWSLPVPTALTLAMASASRRARSHRRLTTMIAAVRLRCLQLSRRSTGGCRRANEGCSSPVAWDAGMTYRPLRAAGDENGELRQQMKSATTAIPIGSMSIRRSWSSRVLLPMAFRSPRCRWRS